MEVIEYGDIFGREFKSLRVSLTQYCNFSCVYCVPEGKKFQRLKDELSPDEFRKSIALIDGVVGLKKLRVTGGEPLTYKNFDEFIGQLSNFPHIEKSITTNASMLEEKIGILIDAGFGRINISIDSIDPARFREISRGGNYTKVFRGIDKCLKLGLEIKFNMVPMRTHNYSDIIELLDYCLENGITLRYIELMKMGHVQSFFEKDYVSQREILDLISKKYKFDKASTEKSSTSQIYKISGKGQFGIIANESMSFCHGCDRLRLTSNGCIYGCISSIRNYDIRELIELGQSKAEAGLREILLKAMKDKQMEGFVGAPTYMKHIGG